MKYTKIKATAYQVAFIYFNLLKMYIYAVKNK